MKEEPLKDLTHLVNTTRRNEKKHWPLWLRIADGGANVALAAVAFAISLVLAGALARLWCTAIVLGWKLMGAAL